MDALRLVLLFVHLIAFAGLLGSLLAQFHAAEQKVTGTMLNSARVAFLVGLLSVGVLEADDAEVNHAKIGIKLLVALVVVGLLEANRKKPTLTQALYFIVLGLTLLNAAVAVFVSSAHS